MKKRLDTTAIVHTARMNENTINAYRISIAMDHTVNPQLLQQAVDMTMPRFPTYKVAIRKGLFWRYLEPNDRPGPFVQKDIKNSFVSM